MLSDANTPSSPSEVLTVDRLRELLNYDPDTGVFTWRVARKKCSVGAIAGCLSGGYIAVMVEGRYYRCHRLAWCHFYGVWPEREIDHINLVKSDNRISNLREVSSSQNKQNKPKQANNTSGFKGVSWHKRDSRWQAKIMLNGKLHFLGMFDIPEDASAAYEDAALKLHTNRPTFKRQPPLTAGRARLEGKP